jgi:hypothetical protein
MWMLRRSGVLVLALAAPGATSAWAQLLRGAYRQRRAGLSDTRAGPCARPLDGSGTPLAGPLSGYALALVAAPDGLYPGTQQVEVIMGMTRWGEPMRLPVVLLAAGLMWLGAAAPLAAQSATEGTRVRVTAPEHMEEPCIGRVVSAADPLVVRDKNGTMHYIPAPQIELLEISRGRNHVKGFAVGSGVGGVIGMVAGGAIGYTTYEGPDPEAKCSWTDPDYPASCPYEPLPAWGRAIVGSIVGGVAGAGAGALVGYGITAITPERWTTVLRRSVHTSAGWTRHGWEMRVDLPTR